MRRGIAPVVWAIIALIAAVGGNALADSKTPLDSPLHTAQVFAENVKSSILSIVGQDAGYKEQLKAKHAAEYDECKQIVEREKNASRADIAAAWGRVCDQIAVDAGLKAPTITAPIVSPESRPIRGVSRAFCDIYSSTAPTAPKEYTLSENQQITLETGEKVKLEAAIPSYKGGQTIAYIAVDSRYSQDLYPEVPKQIGSVIATLKSVPQLGTAIISFSTTPKRTQPVILAYLLRFGSYMDNNSLRDVADAFETSFEKATGGRLHLCITIGGSTGLPPEDASHPYSRASSRYPWLRGDSIRRVWYVDNSPTLMNDIGNAAKALGFSSRYDVLIALSEAQQAGEGGTSRFESYGFNEGYFGIQGAGGANLIGMHQPLETGYLTGSGYVTTNRTLYQLADTFIHELGHYMGLDHSCPAGCSGCASQDVMSVCRPHPGASDTYYNDFSQCSMDWITGRFVPALLNNTMLPVQRTACG